MKYNIIYIDPPWHYNKRNNANTKFGLGCIGMAHCVATQEELLNAPNTM